VRAGAKVTILDALLPQHGGNMKNLAGIETKVEVVVDDIRNSDAVRRVIADKDVIFNLAGQVSYTESMTHPFLDLDISCLGHLTILEACRQFNPRVRIVFSSSRMVYRRNPTIPVAVDAPVEPLTIYGVHKLTGEHYHRLYSEVYDIPTAVVRITNPYGPRQRVEGGKYGIVNWFLTLAMRGDRLRIFGDGSQMRDYIYIDDLVEVFLRIARLPEMRGEIYNGGSGCGTTFRTMAESILEAAGKGDMQSVAWPDNYSRFETGDFIADISRTVDAIGYRPETSLQDGLARTVAFYRETGQN
jgi:nucleoside-diphosphate-sugar epimerase